MGDHGSIMLLSQQNPEGGETGHRGRLWQAVQPVGALYIRTLLLSCDHRVHGVASWTHPDSCEVARQGSKGLVEP